MEAMRIAINEVGNLYYQSGDFTQALKSYLRGKDLQKTTDATYELCIA
jgi:hypothetical protein